MLIEKIIFNILAFSLFVFIFFKMIQKNDTNYVVILCLEAVGIAINFIEIIFRIPIAIGVRIFMYVVSVVLPIAILVLEKRGMNFSEIIFLLLAKIALKRNNTKAAKNFLMKLVNKYPNSYVAHKMLAEIYQKEGGMRRAIDEYVQVIDIQKNDYQSYYQISYLLHELGKKEEASQMLTSLLRKKPEYREATQLLGDILCEQERYKEAANVYHEAIKYHPADYDLYYSMGMVYTMLNDFKNAQDCYQKAAEINTLLYNAYYCLAEINLIYNDLDEAEKYFMQSTKGEEVEPKAYYQLAKIYMIKGDKENAIKFVNVAIDTDKSYYKKAEAEPIFIPIKSFIKYPDFEAEEERNITLSKKEQKAQKHLEETTKLVGKLSLNTLKIRRKDQKVEEQKGKEREN